MSGHLALLTPIASPMVTRATSPTAWAAAGVPASSDDSFYEPAAVNTAEAMSGSECADPGLLAAELTAAVRAEGQLSTSCSAPALPPHWRSAPSCAGCGAAKGTGGCSGCGGKFCGPCMGRTGSGAVTRAADSSSSNGQVGSCTSSSNNRDSVREAAPGSCSNCSSLCNACKPVACCFCVEMREQASPVGLCEACAGVCDACQRAACGDCRNEFSGCSSCGYAVCEECRLQLQLQSGGVSSSSSLIGHLGTISCWCAPPLRTASNVRHVSSQRYQMAQLHPSMWSSTMEAAGLRDADYDEDDVSYEDDDVITGVASGDDYGDAAGCDQQGHSHAELRSPRQGLAGLMSSKSLETVMGALPGFAGHLGHPLSPSSSSHSSHMAQHVVPSSYHGPGMMSSVMGYGVLRQPEHSLKGWLNSGSL